MYRIIFVTTIFVLSLHPLFLPAQTRRALLIGISQYDTQNTYWSTIHGSNDVALLNKALAGFKVTKLTDAQATFANIDRAIKNLTTQAKTGDIVYIHFSGHGQPVEDTNGDEDDGWDEAFIPYDAPMMYEKGVYEGNNHLTDDKLHEYIQTLRKKIGKTGILYVSIDACHSGESFRGGEFEDEEGELVEDNYIATLDIIPEDGDTEDYERGSSTGFSTTGKPYAVRRSTAKVRGIIQPSPSLSKVVMLESCLSTQKSKEVKLTIKNKDGKLCNFYCGPLSYAIYKILTQSKTQLGTDTNWVSQVRTIFNSIKQSDNKQQLVIEKSE